MADFDPDKYLAANAPANFDPDKYLASKAPATTPGLGDEALGVLKNSIVGGADTIQRIGRAIPVAGPITVKTANALSAAIDAAGSNGIGQGDGYLDRVKDAYGKYSQMDSDHEAVFAKEHPNLALGEGMVGSALVPIPGAGAAGAAGALTRVGGTAALMGADTALRGGDAAESAKAAGATGAITAGVESLPYIGKALGPVASKLADSPIGEYLANKFGSVTEGLSDLAERKAYKATEPSLRAQENAQNMGSINRIGRQLLDDNTVNFGSSVKNIAENAAANKSKYGSQIGSALKTADEYASTLDPRLAPTFTIKPSDLSQAITERLIEPLQGDVASTDRINALQKIAENLNSEGIAGTADAPAVWSLADANKQKTNIGTKLKTEFGREQSPIKEAYKDVYSLLNNTIEQKMTDLNGLHNQLTGQDASFADDFLKAKEGFGPNAEAASNASKAVARNEKNRSASLTSYIAGAGAGGGVTAMFGPVVGGAVGLGVTGANMLAKRRGNAALAKGADVASDLMERLASDPQSLGKYAAPLASAASRGRTSLAAAHYVLSQSDPKYQSLFNGSSNDDEGADQ